MTDLDIKEIHKIVTALLDKMQIELMGHFANKKELMSSAKQMAVYHILAIRCALTFIQCQHDYTGMEKKEVLDELIQNLKLVIHQK